MGTQLLLPQRGTAPPPIFGSSVAAKWLHGSRCHLAWSYASPKGGEAPKFSAHVYCGQTAGWMKLVLGVEAGLSPGDFVLDGTPLPLLKRWADHSPNFRPMFIAAKRLDHNEADTWHKGRPQPRRLCVSWGPSPLLPKRGGASSPIFGPFLLWPNGSMHRHATWYGCWPQPRGLCVRWRPSLPSPTKGTEPPPNFRPISIVPKRLDASRCHSVWR